VSSKKEIILAVPLRLLGWLDHKPSEKLPMFIRRVFQLIRHSAEHTVSQIVENYYRAHLFALIYSILGFPLLIGIFSFLHISYPWLCVIILPISLPFLTELFWRNAAIGNPRDYLKVISLKSRGIYISFGILIAAFALTVSFSYYTIFLNTNLLLLSLISFAVVTLMLIGFSFFVVFTMVLGNLVALFYWKTYLEITARTCLNSIVAEQDLKKGVSTFRLALECINERTNYQFRLGFAKLTFYSNYFKLIALSRNDAEKERIRNVLANFSFKINSDLDLTETIMSIHEITGKPIFLLKDMYEELDFDVSLGKRISEHKELVTAVIGIIGVILTFISVYPLLSNAWTELHLSNPFANLTLYLLN